MTSSSQWILPISGQTLHFRIPATLKFQVPAQFNLYALILEIQRKGRKCQIIHLQFQYTLKLKYTMHIKLQLNHWKSKLQIFRVLSFSLSLLYGFSLSRKFERETLNSSNFSNDKFKKNSEVVMSQNPKISNFPGCTFSKFLCSIQY